MVCGGCIDCVFVIFKMDGLVGMWELLESYLGYVIFGILWVGLEENDEMMWWGGKG